MKYPIKDIQHHEQALRDMDDVSLDDPENVISVRYHMTAICALQLGAAHDIEGPAHEFIIDGETVVRQVCEYLIDIKGENGTEFAYKPLEPIE